MQDRYRNALHRQIESRLDALPVHITTDAHGKHGPRVIVVIHRGRPNRNAYIARPYPNNSVSPNTLALRVIADFEDLVAT